MLRPSWLTGLHRFSRTAESGFQFTGGFPCVTNHSWWHRFCWLQRVCQRTEGLSERKVIADGFRAMWHGRERREKLHWRTNWNRLRSQEDGGTAVPGIPATGGETDLSN